MCRPKNIIMLNIKQRGSPFKVAGASYVSHKRGIECLSPSILICMPILYCV